MSARAPGSAAWSLWRPHLAVAAGALFAILSCSRQEQPSSAEVRGGTNVVFSTDPAWMKLGESEVSVQVAPDPGGGWVVTVSMARKQPAPPIDGASVKASLTDTQGRMLPLREQPTGALIEVGGSQATTSQAVFRFRDLGAPPEKVEVHHAGGTAHFRLVRS